MTTPRSPPLSLTGPGNLIYTQRVAIYITNPEAEELARQLSLQTGETITDTVIAALRERKERLNQLAPEKRVAALLEISNRASAIIGDSPVDIDELYNDEGLPK